MRRVIPLLASVALVASAVRVSAAPVVSSTGPSRVQTLTGITGGPYLGTPEIAARAALKDLAARLPQLSATETLKLERVWEYSGGKGSSVRFSQLHAGIPVLDATVTVRLNGQGNVVRVSSSLQAVGTIATQPKISQADAINAARNAVNLPLPATQSGGARLVIANGRLAWDVYVDTLDPSHAITVVVDAQTGAYLFQREHAKQLKQGKIFKTSKDARDARQSNGSFDASKLTTVALSGLVNPGAGRTLNSDVVGATNYTKDIVGYDCCPTTNCDGQTPPPKVSGTFQYGSHSVPYETVICDEKPIPVADSNGDFLFSPVQEPTSATPMGSQADGDPFAVVNAYYHATEQLAYLRKLEPKFVLGPNAQPLRVTANYLQPDFDHASGGFSGTLKVTQLTRFDNSQFVPAGMMEAMYGAGFKRNFDSVMLYQGTTSDFAYDGQVVAHEFTHGVVEATAGLQDYSFDEWGVTDAPGAMNEGLADYWAAARFNDPNIGEYVGDLSGQSEASLRTLENDYTCPSVLSGEVHWDSQHFSAALWAARKAIGGTNQQRLDYDAAILRAMSTIDPLSSYENAALSVVSEMEQTFGTIARDMAADAFTARGFGTFSYNDDGSANVTGCERAIDVGQDTPYKPVNQQIGLLLPPQGRFTPYAPAAVQFRITPPAGATKVNFKLSATNGQSFPGTSAFFKADSHIAFSMPSPSTSVEVQNDAEQQKNFGSTGKVSFDVDGGCGDKTYYLAIANLYQGQSMVQGLSLTYDIDQAKQHECAPVDSGSGGDTAKVKTGCQSVSVGVFALAGLGVMALARRRRKA